ncbi:LBP / BPI / CETP family protein [Onchocerca flexuosa]|uniref:LBP / BPI / CETP family protein n=2 Tax=Onchocerca flexuosa TaxID=387005 RepID=A0A238C0F5_9BILA|nr:LBP / BPI / CETP family protein [Onchocerca flexuosa]
MMYFTILILFFATLNTRISGDANVSTLLLTNTNVHNPGLLMRLMPSGLAYLREIGMKVVNDEILRIQLPTITETIETGQVSIYDAYVSKYWSPPDYSLELSPPDMFTWSMAKMHIRAAGEFEALFTGPLLITAVPIRGQFETLFGHVSLTMAVRLVRTRAGAPMVQSTYCRADVGYVDLNVRNTGVITDFFINTFKAFIIAHFKPIVEDRICQMIKNMINKDMNYVLATMPLQIPINENSVDVFGISLDLPARKKPLSKFGEIGTKNITLLNIINHLRQKSLVLDYRLIRDPVIAYGTIEMLSRGEISWNGYGGTPFYPPNIYIPPPTGVHMAEFIATDYMVNSLLFHAYKQKYMDFIIGPESSPQLKTLLLTTCKSGYCIGEYLGELSNQFPDREVEIHFSTRKSPLFVFVENRARFRLYGSINMFVRPENSTQSKLMVVRADTKMTSNIKLWLNQTKIIGNVSVENLDFKLLESRIQDVDQAIFDDLGLFAAEFLEQLLTDILRVGIIIPTMKGVILKNPRLSLHDRYLNVQAYFRLDEGFASKLIQGAVKQTFRSISSFSG